MSSTMSSTAEQSFVFAPAKRTQVKLKLGISGPSGAGKTEGALWLARQLVGPDGVIGVADTENESAALYADRHDFLHLPLRPPFESRNFMKAIDAAVAAGVSVLIIDSLSHQWEGTGGILDRKSAEERAMGPRANGFALWAKYKEEHRRFMAHLLNSPIHIVACMRSKQVHVQEGNKIHKMGLAPVTGEDAEYDFSIVFDLNMEHVGVATKDRSRIFDGRPVNLRDDNPGGRIRAWLEQGAPMPTPAPAAAPVELPPAERLMPRTTAFPHLTGKKLGELMAEEIDAVMQYATTKDGTGWRKLESALETITFDRLEEAAGEDAPESAPVAEPTAAAGNGDGGAAAPVAGPTPGDSETSLTETGSETKPTAEETTSPPAGYPVPEHDSMADLWRRMTACLDSPALPKKSRDEWKRRRANHNATATELRQALGTFEPMVEAALAANTAGGSDLPF